MTNEEAKEVIGLIANMKVFDAPGLKEAVMIAQDTIEKQIPKPVVVFTVTYKGLDDHYHQSFYPKCPNWLEADAHKDDMFFQGVDCNTRLYCSRCGQALDWSHYDEQVERKKADFDEEKLIEDIKESGGEP